MNEEIVEEAARRRRRIGLAARLSLASIAVVGIGAAITIAAWTDDVYFGATATSSSFDLQGRVGAGDWEDIGIPGETTETAPIELDVDAVELSPGVDVDLPFELCNVGTADGTITAISTPTLAGELFDTAGAEVTATVDAPSVGTAVPSDPTCASPISGNLNITTTADFPPAAMGLDGTIVFFVTGTSD
ncbi:hypothetical protein [Protaetiibacter mangrovi]|uniref:Ribosomally synthesized peptide with SipW-like signal peptide n=1 Tax=Protaetiibacter mangrovi TaxID=2970926 RepID=A0ABT1ZJ11_9MICO|nr:hypothetical protein [Protaetiibacter mangrovi]MCS0500705.1 hypothetical protein [Protaetiibacter mangrovi]TPW91049.1 hypothetical protein FJ656_36260 [Schumannella luteola]